MIPDFDTQSPYFLPLIAGGLVLLVVLLRVRFIGTLIRTVFSLALIGLIAMILIQRAPYDPLLAGIADRFDLDGQEVAGEELRIRMAPDGHFYANATLNGVERRMLIDSGATVTALSAGTADAAGLEPAAGLLPVVMKTANGMTRAETATVDELRMGNIVARDLRVVVSPALGDMDLLGMNFLSKLKGWRVEGRTLILVPHHPQEVGA